MKRRKLSLASNQSSTTTVVKGGVTRVLFRYGVPVSTQLYFRQKKVALSGAELTRLQTELKLIKKAEFPLEQVSQDTILDDVQAFTFCSIRHAPIIDRFGRPYSRRTVIRAPRCDDQFHTVIQTDVVDSYAVVYSILDFCDQTYCFVRWVTPTYPGSQTAPAASHVCAQNFRKFKVTDVFAVISILQVQAVVCFVPVFASPGFVWLNHRPMGTALRAYAEESSD